VALAGVPDLRAGAEGEVCGDAIPRLLGGPPLPEERLPLGSPAALLPLGVDQRLVCGSRDRIVPPELSDAYAEAARRAGDSVSVARVEGAGHFELVDPASAAWPTVLEAIREIVGDPPTTGY
jgi:pimeloyl-ACP methyl ester carboxylesterase